MGPATETAMEAVYFDTADLDLLRLGVTLRRRPGGENAAWHVKLPDSTVAKESRTNAKTSSAVWFHSLTSASWRSQATSFMTSSCALSPLTPRTERTTLGRHPSFFEGKLRLF